MSAQHTPGPWHFTSLRVNAPSPSRNGCDIGAKDGSNIAIVLHGPLDRDVGETIANARLIAAAPDLLAALEAAIDAGIIPKSSALEGGAMRHSEQIRVADMCRAFIAKATGGAA